MTLDLINLLNFCIELFILTISFSMCLSLFASLISVSLCGLSLPLDTSIEQPQFEPPIFRSGLSQQKLSRIHMMLVEVDGSLTSLSEYKGFRQFFVAKATEIGITGTIQRIVRSNVRIVFEADSQLKMDSFTKFLDNCTDMEMIKNCDFESQEYIPVSLRFKNFRILTNFSSRVLKGNYTEGNDFDNVSVSSSNSEVSMLK